MQNDKFYNDTLIEHNIRPDFKCPMEDADMTLNGINPSCGDDISLFIKYRNGIIEDISFDGVGCAVSQASADIMAGLVIGKTKQEALYLTDIFTRMIRNEATDDEIEELEEASELKDISHMPARVKCATLGWRTLKEALEKAE